MLYNFQGSTAIFPNGSTLSEHRRILVWLSPREFFAEVITGLSEMLFRQSYSEYILIAIKKGIEKSHANNQWYIKMHHTLLNWN